MDASTIGSKGNIKTESATSPSFERYVFNVMDLAVHIPREWRTPDFTNLFDNQHGIDDLEPAKLHEEVLAILDGQHFWPEGKVARTLVD